MNRRDLIALLGSTAAAWPLGARAQQGERMRRIFVLAGIADDAEARARAEALQQRLEMLGWILGRNVQLDYRFAAGAVERMRAYAKEAVASGPDLIMAQTNPALQAVLDAAPSQPIIFVQVSDPVGGGFVKSLSHPGANITGFTNFETDIGGKWLQTLKEIAPRTDHAAFVLHPETSAHAGFLRAAEAASAGMGIGVTPLPVRSAIEIERSITEFAAAPRGGLIVAPHPLTRGKLIIELGRTTSAPGRLSVPLPCTRWRSRFLRHRPSRAVAKRSYICGPHPSWH